MYKAVTTTLRKVLNKFGFEVVKLEHLNHTVQMGKWLSQLNIKTIIDVGANEGQFAMGISKVLPEAHIISFEPISSVFATLQANVKGLNVTAHNYALSDADGTAEINISQNLVSSSILNMEDLHKNLYPQSSYVSKETITLKTLDGMINLAECKPNILLKIDVQGYENKVIGGGHNVIKNVAAVIIEFSYQPVYEGQWLFEETYDYFTSNGFKFLGFADQVLAKQSQLPLYGDAIFVKRELAAKLQYA
jgi:FkbM family methyltransferase